MLALSLSLSLSLSSFFFVLNFLLNFLSSDLVSTPVSFRPVQCLPSVSLSLRFFSSKLFLVIFAIFSVYLPLALLSVSVLAGTGLEYRSHRPPEKT